MAAHSFTVAARSAALLFLLSFVSLAPTPASGRTAAPADVLAAERRLQARAERAFEIRRTPDGAHAVKIFDGASELFSGPPDTAARAFIDAHRDLFGLAPEDVEALELASVTRGIATEHVRFRRTSNGLTVHDRFVFVHSMDGRVVQVDADAAPPPSLAIAPPRLTESDAVAALTDRIGIRPDLRGPATATLGIGADAFPGRLAYEVRIPSNEPLGDFVALVDAATGEVGAVRDVLKHLDGMGFVFDPNPIATTGDTSLRDENDADLPELTAARFLRTLTDLDGSGHLRGSFCDATSVRTPRALEPTLLFDYTRSDERFEETTAYHAVTKAQRYLQDTLGIFDANNRQQIVHTNGASWSIFSPLTRVITLGEYGVDAGEDAEAVLHEYGHAILEDLVPGFGATDEGHFMEEGFCDYLAASLSDDPERADLVGATVVAEWADARFPPPRRVDTAKVWPRDRVFGPLTAERNGEIWSAALWRIRDAIGRDAANRLILEHVRFLTPTARFHDAAYALFAADRALNRGAHRAVIASALRHHGLLPKPVHHKGQVNAGVLPPFVSDSAENGFARFTMDTPLGRPGWSIVEDSLATSPPHVFKCTSTNAFSAKDDRLVLEPVLLPADRPSTLRFFHRFTLGTGQAAVLEYSVDGSPFTDSIPRFIEGGYNVRLRDTLMSIGSRRAWAGQQSVMTRVTLDLEGLAGRTIQFRWRLVCRDGNIGTPSWYVDDIQLSEAIGGSAKDVLFVNRVQGSPSDDIESDALTPGMNWVAQGTHEGWRRRASVIAHSPYRVWAVDAIGEPSLLELRLIDFDLRRQPTTLTFWHHFDTEARHDGGRLYLRRQSGEEVDLGVSHIVEGGYNDTLRHLTAPMAPGPAWTGYSGGAMSEVVVDLSDFALEVVDIVWRFACDEREAWGGWRIDDVAFGAATGVGGEYRTVRLSRTSPFLLEIDAAPGGPRPARFAVFLWSAPFEEGTIVPVPNVGGYLTFPIAASGGTPQPAFIWSNLGARRLLGPPNVLPPLAPTVLVNDLDGLGIAAEFTVQGIVADRVSAGSRRFSVTNAIGVRVR